MVQYKLTFENVDREGNILCQAELDTIREVYGFPASVRTLLPRPGQSIRDAPEGYTGIYYYNFYYGLRLPIPKAIINLSNAYDVPLAQFNPNAFRAILSLYHLLKIRGQRRTMQVEQVARLYKLGAGNGSWVSFVRWEGKPLPLPDSVQGWKNQFFYIGGTGWLDTDRDGVEMSLAETWVDVVAPDDARVNLPEGVLGEKLEEVVALPVADKKLANVLQQRFPG